MRHSLNDTSAAGMLHCWNDGGTAGVRHSWIAAGVQHSERNGSTAGVQSVWSAAQLAQASVARVASKTRPFECRACVTSKTRPFECRACVASKTRPLKNAVDHMEGTAKVDVSVDLDAWGSHARENHASAASDFFLEVIIGLRAQEAHKIIPQMRGGANFAACRSICSPITGVWPGSLQPGCWKKLWWVLEEVMVGVGRSYGGCQG